MAHSLSLYFFGDQQSEFRDHLSTLLLTGGDSTLNIFFDKVALSLRQEVQTLSWTQREKFPSFCNILDLLSIDAAKPLHPALQLALSSVYHLAAALSRKTWESKESISTGSEYSFGFGSGIFAASAFSCYSTPEQFIPVAVETVLISFRTGLLAANTRDQIVDNSYAGSWRVKVDTDKPDTLRSQLREFCAENKLQRWSRPYICGAFGNSIFLCGSPKVVEDFLRACILKTFSSSVNCPFHASHLFSENDVESITQSISPTIADITTKHTLLSHYDGKAQPPQSLPFLLKKAVRAILREEISSSDVIDSIKDMVQSHVSRSYTVVSIGTPDNHGLRPILRENLSNTNEVVFVNDESIVKKASIPQHARQPKIAITGFAGRFPEAENLTKFWDVLHGGVDTHAKAPKTRWDVETHVDPLVKRKNTSGTPYGCWLNTPGFFDRSFFSISPREAPQMDPAQRMALMCAYEAIEMSGIVADSSPSTMKSRVGVFIGSTSNDWCETNSAQDVDNYFIPGGNRAFIPGRINYYFKFSGPSFSVDTACSSSLAATHLACNALWRNDIDTAIVGGTNVLTNPDVTAGLDRGHFLSRTGNCKTFDDGADGYCRGEGVGIVILKRLEDAIADRDPIHGCILAAVTNHSAEAESITRPHVGAQQALFSSVLAKGGIQPNDVSYVEMHGTGTQAGDGREMASVSQSLAPWTQGDPRCRQDDLYVGSVKANVGHGESVAGVTALIKVLLMMQKEEIPPHCGIKTKINQTFPTDLDQRRIRIAQKPTAWPRTTSKPRRVLLNNFSAAGGNSCILVEDGPDPATQNNMSRLDNRPAQVITLSAKSKTALEANTRALAQMLKNSEHLSIEDLAFTSTARRLHYNFRSSYQAENIAMLTKSLELDIENPPQQFRGPPKMIFAFAGQGSNHPGMAKYLYDTDTKFKSFITRFDTITRDQGFGSILPYLRGADGAEPEASPITVQLSHVSLQMALARLWESWGVSPVGVVGHSLGEYAALNFAGVLSDFDVLWICGQRARLLESQCQAGAYGMLAARSSHEEIRTILKDIEVEIACINGPKDIVISGPCENIDRSALQLDSASVRYTRMKLPYAFHSSQLEPIMDDFSKILEGLNMKSPKLPILSPLRSAVIDPGESLGKDYLLQQCRQAVNLVGAVKAGESTKLLHDRTHFIEMGPSLVLSKLLQRNMENSPINIPSLEPDKDSWLVLSRSVATAYRVGCNINWAQYHRDYDHSVVQLPSYNWDLKDYWIQYVHDWSLRKGDPLPVISGSASQLNLATASCQKVVFVESQGDLFHVIIESDLQSKELKPVVAGHKVNGIAVCIGSAYADMAYSCAEAILKHFQEDVNKTAILVKAMDMQEAMIINDTSGPQIIKIDAKYSQKQRKVEVAISSAQGKITKLHAKADVVFEDRQKEMQNMQQKIGSVGTQIDLVKNNVTTGLTERFTTSMAYRMVASLAHYDNSHKGVKEAYLDSSTLEAHSVISTPAPYRLQGDFTMHPCVFDSILQLATFVLNANENSRFDQEVYVVRGWESVFIDGILSPDETYEAYVKMVAQDKDVSFGDIAIKKGSTLTGCIQGVRVQRVPRRLMDVMFKPKGESASSSAAASQPAKKEAKRQPDVNEVPKAASGPSKLDKALAIISEESGISIPEMKEDDLLSDLGIDSLLILVIASRFREELNLDLSPIFFVEYSSIGAIRGYFGTQETPAILDSGVDSDTSYQSDAEKSSSASSAPEDSDSAQDDVKPKEAVKNAKKAPRSTSILLQGTIGPKTKTMFMFPDGSGSATSYMHLPRIHEDVALVAMNCPYMTKPQDFEGTFEDITKILLAEVRRRQPKGPYWIGGWSAGGAFAHYAARLLAEAGEEIKALLLIDAPCPIGLGKLPQCFFDYWKTIHQPGGPVEDRPLPPWIMDHFQAVNDNLRWYNASPLPRGCSPRTYLIWAAKGTDNLVGFPHRHLLTPAESEDLGFLMDDKTDFGPKGWEKLVEGNIEIKTAMTSNHFTITRNEGAKMVSELIKKACVLD